MRPGVGETLLILDKPREVSTFNLGMQLALRACLHGIDGFEEHYYDRLRKFSDNNPFTVPQEQNDEIMIDTEHYETAWIAVSSIAALYDHEKTSVIAKSFFRQRLARKILSNLELRKNIHDDTHKM